LRKMAEEAGFERDEWSDFGGNAPVLEAFARLVAEDCAKMCDNGSDECADAIRAKYGIKP
jgi:hypothetical protein